MRTPLAQRNVLHRVPRSLAALLGVSFAIFLIFAQLGFRSATAGGANVVFAALDYDLVLLSPQYELVARPRELPRETLARARSVPGVASVIPLQIKNRAWRNPETGLPWSVLLIGVDLATQPFEDAAIGAQLGRLAAPGTVLMDGRSRSALGRRAPGDEAEIVGRRVRVVGSYALGAGFLADATAITSERTFARILGEPRTRSASLGLVRLQPGRAPEAVAQELQARLGPVAQVLTRAEHMNREARFWLEVKPIGVSFTSGLWIAFLAGAVILYQVVAGEVQNRLGEYATLRALGFADREVYAVVLGQAALFSMLGFVPALLAAFGLYDLVRSHALLPVAMTWGRALGVLALTAVMCVAASALAARRLQRADPADLF